MIRPCSKCRQGNMRSETQPIPRQVPMPIIGAIPFNVENYLPDIIRDFRNYTVFVCDTCGNLEFALS